MISQMNVMVSMRDGVELSVDVFRPDNDEACPALVAMSPYGKEIQTMPQAPQPVVSSVHRRSIEAGDPEFLTQHGYAHIIADVRGMGKSGGSYRGWMSSEEGNDGYDLIEWVASQPWCDGMVGMVGVSYYGAVQLNVAATKPPSLKAIMPFNAPADFYRESTHHGGILQTFFMVIYTRGSIGRSALLTREEMTSEEFDDLAIRLQADPDNAMYADMYSTVHNPDRLPAWFDVVAHPLDGPFYWERSPYRHYDKIEIPVYCGSAWWAYSHMHLRGAFQNYSGIDAPKKLQILPRTQNEAPLGEDYNREVVRWYDHWLKGEETGIMDEPPINLYVTGDDKWRFEQEWPLARTEWTKLHLRRWQSLSQEPEMVPDGPDNFVQQPPNETNEIHHVEYATAPLADDMEITGPVALKMYASIDADDANWIVALEDVYPDGTAVELTRGFLKASHRAVDKDRSKPWEPWHPHLESEPVPPNEVINYDISLTAMSNVFRRGHRIRLRITGSDNPKNPGDDPQLGYAHRPWHVVRNETVLHRVHHEPAYPSHLLVPVIPRDQA